MYKVQEHTKRKSASGGRHEPLNPAYHVEFVQANPKKRGSAAFLRYDQYKKARTIGEATRVGALPGDLKNDLDKGYMQVLQQDLGGAACAPSPLVAMRSSGNARSLAPSCTTFVGPPAPSTHVKEGGGERARASMIPSCDPPSHHERHSPLLERLKERGTWTPTCLGAAARASAEARPPAPASRATPSSSSKAVPAAAHISQVPMTGDSHPPAPMVIEPVALDEKRRLCLESAERRREQETALAAWIAAPITAPVQLESATEEEVSSDEDLLQAAFAAEEQRLLATHSDMAAAPVDDAAHQAPLEADTLGIQALGASTQDLDHLSPEEEVITLRLRLGVVFVKQESDAQGSSTPGVAECSIPCPDTRSSDLRQVFDRQKVAGHRLPQEADGDEAPLGSQEVEQREQTEQLNAAQIASYDCNVNERQKREARNRELVQQGDLEPLEAFDRDLLEKLYEAELFSWFESAENRCLMYRFLEIQSRAKWWYREAAEEYFAEQRARLDAILGLPDVADILAPLLLEETQKVEAAIYAMPEKGRFVPELFAPRAFSNGSQECVELD